MRNLIRTGIWLLLPVCLAWGGEAWGGEALRRNPPKDVVVLLHGLARTERSMKSLGKRLSAAGYEVVNLGYPSTKHPIERLARDVKQRLDGMGVWSARRVHFVTHSMGGILVRAMFAQERPENLGRVVMLCPPNQGSEVVDHLGATAVFSWLNGPAGRQLGTDKDSLPNTLGPVPFETGVITGNRSFNPLFSHWLEGEDDGKVSVARARVEGMADFLAAPFGHTFIMNQEAVAGQVLLFLKTGRFDHSTAPVS